MLTKIFTLSTLLFFIVLNPAFAQDINDDLWNAIKKNDMSALEEALSNGADINKGYEAPVMWQKAFGITDGKSVTPLMFAVMNKNKDMVLKLLQSGAKANKMTTCDKAGAMTIPSYMTYKGSFCTGKKILAVTALYLAIDLQETEIIKLLIQSKKFNGSQPMTVISNGSCLITSGTAMMSGVKCTNCGNQAMIGPKKFAKLNGYSEIVEIFKGYKKTDWYKNGLPQ